MIVLLVWKVSANFQKILIFKVPLIFWKWKLYRAKLLKFEKSTKSLHPRVRMHHWVLKKVFPGSLKIYEAVYTVHAIYLFHGDIVGEKTQS